MPQLKKILLVDDDDDLREALSEQLVMTEDFDVFEAATGQEALTKLKAGHFDLVILDVGLPDTDGRELARVMRADPRLKAVPIIMITSRTADKHRSHAMEIGVNVYLGKPYQEQQLLDHIARQLGQAVAEPV